MGWMLPTYAQNNHEIVAFLISFLEVLMMLHILKNGLDAAGICSKRSSNCSIISIILGGYAQNNHEMLAFFISFWEVLIMIHMCKNGLDAADICSKQS